jgi:hypothetical protein
MKEAYCARIFLADSNFIENIKIIWNKPQQFTSIV